MSAWNERLDAFLEATERWRNGVLLVGFVGALVVAFQVPSAREPVAHGVVFAVPLGLVLLAFIRLRAASAPLSFAWLAVGLLAATASGLAALHAIDPAPPLDEARLSLGESAALSVDGATGGASPFTLEVRGHVPRSARRSTDGRYVIAVSRGSETLEIEGRLYRDVREDRSGRGGPPSRTIQRHETERREVVVGGEGALSITLTELDGIDPPLRVATVVPFSLTTPWTVVLALVVLLALAIEVMSARAHVWAPVTAVVGVSLVLGIYVALRYDADQPLITVLGALLTAALTGGGGGLFVGFFAALVGRRLG